MMYNVFCIVEDEDGVQGTVRLSRENFILLSKLHRQKCAEIYVLFQNPKEKILVPINE